MSMGSRNLKELTEIFFCGPKEAERRGFHKPLLRPRGLFSYDALLSW